MIAARIDPRLTIRRDHPRGDRSLWSTAAALGSATVHEAAGRIGALPSAIKPVASGFRVCGPALTVQSPGGDNLWLHRAIDAAKPGDVMVVNVGGEHEYGYWGEIMSTAAQQRDLGGLVIDGCVRDIGLLEEIGFPVFARGLCIRGTGKDFAALGWVNHPVDIGTIRIHAGDLIVGDRDGVVAIPQAQAAATITAGQQRERKEAEIIRQLRTGKSTLELYGWQLP